MFFNKKLKNYRISNLNQKIKIFKKFNVDFVINKNLIKNFQKLNLIILLKIFYKKKIKYIFVSNNFRFGNKREGDVKF